MLLLITAILNAQSLSNPTKIKINLKSKHIDEFGKVKRKHWVQFEFSNFNPYTHQVLLTKGDSVIKVNQPPALFTSFNLDNLTKITGALLSTVITAPGEINFGDDSKTKRLTENSISDLKENLLKDSIRVGLVKQLIDNSVRTFPLYLKCVDSLKNKAENFFDKYGQLIIQTKVFNPDTADRNRYGGNFNFVSFETERKEIIKFKDKLKIDIRDPAIKYQFAISDYSDVLVEPANKNLFIKDSLLKAFNRELLNSFPQFDSALNTNNLLNLLGTLANVQDTNFKYLSLPQQIKDDVASFDIEVKPVPGNAGAQTDKFSMMLPEEQKHFFTFSTGFFVSGLHHENYTNDRVARAPNDTVYNLVKDNPGAVEFGINAMLHFGGRIKSSETHWHTAFGPGITIEKNLSPRLFIGGGLAWGEKNKVMLSLGAVVGQVRRLSDVYKGKTGFKDPQSNYLKDATRGSAFLSLSYSFL